MDQISRAFICFVLLALLFFVAVISSWCQAQNVLIVDGKTIEFPSMTPAEIREMEARQREAERQRPPEPVYIAPPSTPKVIVLRERVPVELAPLPAINIEINARRRTPYSYHFEVDPKSGALKKMRDK
jgi:hypothetical protein